MKVEKVKKDIYGIVPVMITPLIKTVTSTGVVWKT